MNPDTISRLLDLYAEIQALLDDDEAVELAFLNETLTQIAVLLEAAEER